MPYKPVDINKDVYPYIEEDLDPMLQELYQKAAEVDTALSTLETQTIAHGEQINTLDANKVNKYMPDNYRVYSALPSEYPRGLTIFSGSSAAGWNNIGAIGSSVVIRTFKHSNNRIYQEVSGFGTSPVCYRIAMADSSWGPWQTVVTTTQPNWITATLQNGWTGVLEYRRNQIGQVEIRAISLKPGTVANGTIIAQISYSLSAYNTIGVYNASLGVNIGDALTLITNGSLRVNVSDLPSNVNLYFSCVCAAD